MRDEERKGGDGRGGERGGTVKGGEEGAERRGGLESVGVGKRVKDREKEVFFFFKLIISCRGRVRWSVCVAVGTRARPRPA